MPTYSKEEYEAARAEMLRKGIEMGMDWAISMMRDGNLRLYALPFEMGKRPRHNLIRPVKATMLVWKSWWREKRNNG